MSHRIFPSWTGGWWTTLVAVLVLLPATVATAENWIAGSGDWSTPGNWDTGTVPSDFDTVNITPTDGVARTVTYDYTGAPVSLSALSVDLTGAGATRTTFSMLANSLTTVGILLGINGRGTINQSGGTVTTNHDGLDSVIGNNSTGNGIYNLSGTGALSIARNLYVGNSGTGAFNQTGGTNTIASTLRIGSLGTVNLNGGTLRFNGYSRQLTGVFNFTSGTVNLAGNRSFGFDATIADIFGSSPTITSGKGLIVEGSATIGTASGTTLAVNGGTFMSQAGLVVGDGLYPTGTLNITGGGTVTNSGVTLGAYQNTAMTDVSTGTVTVSGAGSTWTTGPLVVGYDGIGTLSITNGATVTTTANCFMALGYYSTGTVTVSGAGSAWNISGDLTAGNLGEGTLTIQDQALVHVGGKFSIFNGTVNLQGGTTRFDDYHRAPFGAFNFTAGTIQLAGNRTVGTDAAIEEFFGALPVIPAGKGLTVEGTATLQTAVALDGGTLRANNLVVNGSLHFAGGLLELTGGTITGLASLSVPTGSEFRASGVQSLRITGAADSTITATGNLTLGNASAVNGFGTQGTLQVGANSVTLLDANDVVFDSLALATLGAAGSPGTFNAANGATLDFGGNISGFGTMNTPNNAAKPLINNGHITGNSVSQTITLTGYVKGVGTCDLCTITGTDAPGFSTATINRGTVFYDGTLEIEIGGTTPGSGYDQLNHILGAATANLGGELDVQLTGGFMPALDDMFEIITAMGGIKGTFTTTAGQLPALGAGLAWAINYGANNVVLAVVAAGPPS